MMEILATTTSLAESLACSECGTTYLMDQLQTYATCCNKPLVVNYRESNDFRKEDLIGRETTMWRYHEMLPVFDLKYKVSLGEGMTPILPLERLGSRYGFENVAVKDEGLNPTGSFKSRGQSMAISKAKELGVTEVIVPTAGNAGGAMSAYAAAAGMKATVIMPVGTPKVFQDECRIYGAKVIMYDGLIDKCGAIAAEIQQETGAWNVSTLKEPYRLEGKKTMGYEIAEQYNWDLPDVIIYPTGGGTGLLGIWKAFKEMVSMGWLEADRLPKMVVVQSSACSPLVDYFSGITTDPSTYEMSIANGLSVPKAFGQDMIETVVRESNGMAVAVPEKEIMENIKEISSTEGISISPEGAAVWMALRQLESQGKVQKHERVLLLNTGNGYKYFENFY